MEHERAKKLILGMWISTVVLIAGGAVTVVLLTPSAHHLWKSSSAVISKSSGLIQGQGESAGSNSTPADSTQHDDIYQPEMPDSQALSKSPTPGLQGGDEKNNRTGEAKPSPPTHDAVFYNGDRNQKLVALTFDDGPDDKYTVQILGILQKEHIHATFFLIGNRVEAHKDIVKLIAAQGNAIGNHSWDHPDLNKLTAAQVIDELQKTDEVLYPIIGYHVELFRPPYGSASKEVVREVNDAGYRIIDWSVDTLDWKGVSSKQILANVNQEIYPGGIILQHSAGGRGDSLQNTVNTLPQIISELRKKGYEFVTVPELLHIPLSRN